jgi:hypothetical protein
VQTGELKARVARIPNSIQDNNRTILGRRNGGFIDRGLTGFEMKPASGLGVRGMTEEEPND